MEKQKETEETQKTNILVTYTKYHEEPLPDRQKVDLGQLEKWVFKWCRGYIFHKETEKMGVEIVETVQRCANKNKPPEEFLDDLKTSLYDAKSLSYRNKVEGVLREPRIIRNFRRIIEMEEANEGRILPQDERVNRIRRYIPMREKTIREHLESMDRKFINYVHDSDDEDEAVEALAGHSLSSQGTISVPEDEAMEDSIALIFMNVMENFLNKAQDRTKDCDKAICTLFCIKEIKNYQKIRPILDEDILKRWESGEQLTQADIFSDYHPDVNKKTAESGASERLAKFKKSFEKTIQEKYPEINF